MAGKLFLCATPIGNLKDVTIRVLETLGEVDLIAAEDTRRARKLLTHYEIKKPIVSFHDRNEIRALPKLMAELARGKKVAQISDAGMPGISDPGHRLVRAAVEAGIELEVLPGASALLTAAVLSALPTDDIRFLGYLPRRAGARHRLFADLKDGRSTLVFYESGRRVAASLSDLVEVLGDRRVFIGRELTKLFEEHFRGTAGEVLETVRGQTEIKGELVLVVEGARTRTPQSMEELVKEVDEEMARGRSKSEAAKVVADRHGLAKRRVYEAVH